MLTPSTMIRSPRNRVHDMLRMKRNERYTKNTQDMFHNKHDMTSFQQSGGGSRKNSNTNDVSFPKPQKAYDIFVFVLIVILLTILFVYLGKCLDTELNEYQEKNKNVSVITLIIIQMICNVALLCIPYCIICHYYPDTLICHYYLVVAAFWVVSLHAQTYLKERFHVMFHPEQSKEAKKSKKEKDDTIIKNLLKDAKRKQKQKHNIHNTPPDRMVSLSTRQDQHQHQYQNAHQHNPTHQTPMMTATEHFNTPVQFNSQDLLPSPSHSQHERSTNIADLF